MNIPNQLTIGRLVLTAVWVALAAIPEEYPNSMLYWKIGYIIAVIAGFTDFFDGYIARKFELITTFGKLMDPLADKIFTVSCFVVLTEHAVVPAWITILILTREFAVNGLRSLAANKGKVMTASWIGKCKTVSQMLVLLVGGSIWVQWIPNIPIVLLIWKILLLWLAIFTLYTGIEYFIKNRNLYMNSL